MSGGKQIALTRQMSQLALLYMPFIPHVVELNNDFVQPWVQGFYPIDTPSCWKYLDIDVRKQQREQSAMSRATK